MVRSNWLKTLIVALASTGLTWAQQAATPPALPGQPGPGAEQVVTIREKDGRAQKCKVLKSWRTPEGAQAHQVQNLETGEIMTLVANTGAAPATSDANGGRIKRVAMHIFHWGGNNTPPAGAPVPPEVVVDPGATLPNPGAPAGDNPAVKTVSTPSLPPTTSGPDWSKIAPVPASSWPAQKPLDPCAPCASCDPQAPCACGPCQDCSTCTPAPAQGPVKKVLGRLFGKKDPDGSFVVSSEQVPCPSCPPGGKVVVTNPTGGVPTGAPCPSQCVTQSGETPQPGDWRQSWGKTTASKTAAAKTNDTSKPSAGSTTKTAAADLPQHNKERPDPLDDPAAYRSPSGHADDKAGAHADKWTAAAPTPPRPPSEVLPRPSVPFQDSGVPAPTARMPAGTQSVTAAGSAPYLPVPVVTVPDVRHPPYGPRVQVPQAPEPNRGLMANAFMTPPPPPSDSERGSGMPANAFTDPPPPPQQGMAGAFGSSVPYMMPPGYGPMGPGLVPPGYGYPPGTYAMGPYGGMGQGMYPQAGYPVPRAPMHPPAYLPPPAGSAAPGYQQAAYPSGQGPSFAQGGGYQVAQAQRHVTDMDDPYQANPNLTPAQLVFKLKESLYPSQREWAAEKLSGLDGRKNGEVVPALVQGAREDPAPSVRAGCVRALARLKVNSMPVVEALRAMRSDSDARVQHEVAEALATLGDSGVQQTSVPAGGK
jgi:hypothetical protein